jgi:hypothetical protein
MHTARELCEQFAGPCDMILNEVDVFECVAHPKKLQVEGIISSRWKSHVGNMCLTYSMWSHILWLIWTPFGGGFLFLIGVTGYGGGAGHCIDRGSTNGDH